MVNGEKQHVEKAYNLLRQMDDKIVSIVIYGELFGGLYSHKDTKYLPKPGIKHVQKGVYYSPDLHFYAFDIRTNNTKISNDDDEKKKSDEDHNDKKKDVLSVKVEFETCLEILKKSGFLYCEPLMIGTFDECVDFKVEDFESTIPAKLGLPPPMDPEDGTLIKNIAEGVVLRRLGGRHARIKIKSSTFYEISGQRKKAQKMKNRNNQSGKRKTKLITKESIKRDAMEKYENLKKNEALFDFIERCVNENRFESVCSKEGELTMDGVKKYRE